MERNLTRKWIRIAVAAGLIGLAAAGYVLAPGGHWVAELLGWVDQLGALGALVFGVAYVVAAVLFVPGSVITLAAGFSFGVVWGTAIVSLASTTGAVVAFLIGRFVARDWAAAKAAEHPRFEALFRAIDTGGFKVVLLVRLVPILPYSAVNYGFSATGVSLRDYALGSWLGMLPATVVYVYLGSAAGSLARIVSGQAAQTPLHTALFVVGGLAAVAVAVFITRRARRELDALAEQAEPANTGSTR